MRFIHQNWFIYFLINNLLASVIRARPSSEHRELEFFLRPFFAKKLYRYLIDLIHFQLFPLPNSALPKDQMTTAVIQRTVLISGQIRKSRLYWLAVRERLP